MNLLPLVVLVLALAESGDKSSLVEASKDAKAKRKTSTTKVITNADVKKSKGVLIERKNAGLAAPVEKTPTRTEKYEADRKARIAAEERLRLLNETIAQLQSEVAKIEQSYYEENDLNRRDTEIVKRFNETKKKLDEALAERDVLLPKPE